MPAYVVYGGQFGDCSKGKCSEIFADIYNVDAVIRVGGSQADHKSVSGRTYNVLPTCTGKRLVVLPFGSYIRLDFLRKEMKGLTPDQLWIDRLAWIISDDSIKEAKESGRVSEISSHGLGTRHAINSRLRGDFKPENFPAYYEELQPYVKDVSNLINNMLEKDGRVLIEGTQGYGLSNHHFDMYPYLTSRTITPEAFLNEAVILPQYCKERIMLLRTFPIRVAGNSGPLPKEITWEKVTQVSGSPRLIEEFSIDNNTGEKKIRRVAEFDADIVVRCINETSPTCIVLNMLDYVDCNCQNGITKKAISFVKGIENQIGRKIDYVGYDSKSIFKL